MFQYKWFSWGPSSNPWWKFWYSYIAICIICIVISYARRVVALWLCMQHILSFGSTCASLCKPNKCSGCSFAKTAAFRNENNGSFVYVKVWNSISFIFWKPFTYGTLYTILDKNTVQKSINQVRVYFLQIDISTVENDIFKNGYWSLKEDRIIHKCLMYINIIF
jgi:hypothetical protein